MGLGEENVLEVGKRQLIREVWPSEKFRLEERKARRIMKPTGEFARD